MRSCRIPRSSRGHLSPAPDDEASASQFLLGSIAIRYTAPHARPSSMTRRLRSPNGVRINSRVDARRSGAMLQVRPHALRPRIAVADCAPRVGFRHLRILELVERQVFRLAFDTNVTSCADTARHGHVAGNIDRVVPGVELLLHRGRDIHAPHLQIRRHPHREFDRVRHRGIDLAIHVEQKIPPDESAGRLRARRRRPIANLVEKRTAAHHMMVFEFVKGEVLRPASDGAITSRAQEAGNAEQAVEMLFVVPAVELRLVLRIDVRHLHSDLRRRYTIPMEKPTTRCCVAGGRPAGMMLAFLLARAGVDVLVLEKHADFLRDFRGDTIHPSTLEVMHELGILDDFLKLPHQEARVFGAQFGDTALTFADFTRLPTHCQFIAFMPQWDFLNFIASRAVRYLTFKLRMSADVTDLIEESGHIVGVRATTPDGPLEVRSNLVVGADGRHSVVREKAGLKIEEFGAPMDVLWFRLPRRSSDPEETIGRFDPGHIFIMINRGSEWQLGFVIPKGSHEQVRERGMAVFRETVGKLAPFLGERVGELRDWDEIKLLTVQVDRLQQWHRPGLLCIGDAAHAMSPVGGIGINLAIQDAIAAANTLEGPLREGT